MNSESLKACLGGCGKDFYVTGTVTTMYSSHITKYIADEDDLER